MMLTVVSGVIKSGSNLKWVSKELYGIVPNFFHNLINSAWEQSNKLSIVEKLWPLWQQSQTKPKVTN